MPMHVLRLERLARRGEELTQEDAKEITEEEGDAKPKGGGGRVFFLPISV